MATAALVLTAVAAVGSNVQQRKASKEQRRQNRVQNKIAGHKRSRNIRRAIAQQRIATAQAVSTGFQLGVEGSTAVAGTVAGITSDTASSIGASNLAFTGQQQFAASQNRISGLQQSANTLQSVGSLASLIGQPQNLEALGI